MTISPQIGNRYAEMREKATRVRERALFLPLRTPTELELQARWFGGDFGQSFISTSGDKIDIVQFGTWNREAGPDFSDAAVSVNGSEPTRGSIEIDLTDRNWEAHGHATNPAFEQTVLHVFIDKSDREFFTRTISNRNVPQVRIDPAVLPETFSANIPLARPGRCQAPLKDLPEERVRSVLDAAAQFRLQKKAARIRAKIDNHGRDEALFQEFAAAFGYKENKLPFTLPAGRIVDLGARMGGLSPLVRQKKCCGDKRFFQRPGPSILEVSIHAHFRCVAKGNGTHRRIARRRNFGQRHLPVLVFGRCRCLAGIRKIAVASIQSAARNRRHAPFRQRCAISAIFENGRAPAGPFADLRRLLFAG